MVFLEILIYGAVQSSIYALLAVGFALIFGVARVINLSHAAFYMMGTYATYALCVKAGLPLPVAIIGGMAFVFLIAVLMDQLIITRIRETMIKVLITTLALSLFFEQCVHHIFGSQHRDIPPLVEGSLTILGVSVAGQRVVALFISVSVLLLLWLVITRSKVGHALLATSQDPEAAQLMGINTSRLFMITTGLAAALAALAGGIVSSFITIYPQMGMMPMIKAFSIVILGGLGSLGGAIIAAIIIGYLETIVAFLFSFNLTELVPMVIIFITLAVRPAGLFGKHTDI